MKKLLLILFLVFSTFSFAQQKEKNMNASVKTIKKVTASPNPFSNYTRISFYNNKAQKVRLSVKNLLGKTVYGYTFLSEIGNNNITFYKEDLISGIYLYTIQTEKEAVTKRLVIK